MVVELLRHHCLILYPSDRGGVKEWAKKQLESLGQLLAKLIEEAAVALPEIIGSIVSWLLDFLGKAATWLAGNLWAVVEALARLIFIALQNYADSESKQPGHK